MVQRKVPNKPDIHSDRVGSDKRSVNLKPSSLQNHQDVKTRGADMKKKKILKRSNVLKQLDFDSLHPPDLVRPRIPQPRKPPQAVVLPPTTKPMSQLTTPNYMKSTSSSAAKKEQSQSLYEKKLSKHGVVSGNKEAKTSGKANGLKTTRALMKNPSSKPGRSLMKNLDVHRGTCSSTLKDFAFPAYLELNPGGNELEGTSVLKVCPYSYCSLNGHHHANLPPLKSFLSSRRRMLKLQRNTKPGCLPLSQAKPAVLDQILDHEKDLTEVELDACSSPEMEQIDFFIEIHGGREENEYNSAEIRPKDQLNELASEPETSNDSAGDYQDVDYEGFDEESCEKLVKTSHDTASSCFDAFTEESLISSSHECESVKYLELVECPQEDADVLVDNAQELDRKCINKDHDDITPGQESAESQYLERVEVLQEEADVFVYGEYSVTIDDDASDRKCIDKDIDLITADQEAIESQYPERVEVLKEEADAIVYDEYPISTDDASDHKCIDIDKDLDQITVDQAKHCSIANGDIVNIMNAVLDQDFVQKPTMLGQESEEAGEFSMRGPNFLPPQPLPEAEKVDLRHQEQDEKRNAEEWMVDYTLRQTVTRLGQARHKKVAMLVEAFEKVMPIAKFELNLGHGSGFDHVRPIQACN